MPRPKSTDATYSLDLRGGTYYVRWWENGRTTRTSCRTANLEEAKVFRASLIAALKTPLAPESPTIGKMLAGYQAVKEGKTHSNAIDYAVRSLKRHLEHLPVASLTSERIENYLVKRRAEGPQGASIKYRKKARPLSDGTLRRELGVLRAALNWAVEEKWFAEAPTFGLPPTQPARERWLTREEAARLLAAADTPHIRTFLALAIFTAARAEAITELTWDRVDEAAGRIVMGTGKVRKQKRRQTVPIPDDLKPYLAEARKAATCPYVVEWRSAQVGSTKRAVKACAEKAKLPGVTAHILRHTAAVWMIQDGIPIKMVADYLGDTVQTVEKHYAKHDPEWLREGAKSLRLFPCSVAMETP